MFQELKYASLTTPEANITTPGSHGITYTFGGSFGLFKEVFRQTQGSTGNFSNTFKVDRSPGCPRTVDVPNMAVIALDKVDHEQLSFIQ